MVRLRYCCWCTDPLCYSPTNTSTKLPSGFLMRGMRGQLWAHDGHDAVGMHFLNSLTNGVVFVTMPDNNICPSFSFHIRKASFKAVGYGKSNQNLLVNSEAVMIRLRWRQDDGTYIAKLHHPDLSQFTDTTVGSFGLEEELSQRHLFTSEEFPHVAEGSELSAAVKINQNLWKTNNTVH